MLSEKEKALRVLLFDSFCRTVLRNAIRNYCKQNTRLQKAEFLTDNPASFCNIEESSADEYNSEHFFIKFKGSAYALDNESLCKAMQELPERELGVLILGYWCPKLAILNDKVEYTSARVSLLKSLPRGSHIYFIRDSSELMKIVR